MNHKLRIEINQYSHSFNGHYLWKIIKDGKEVDAGYEATLEETFEEIKKSIDNKERK